MLVLVPRLNRHRDDEHQGLAELRVAPDVLDVLHGDEVDGLASTVGDERGAKSRSLSTRKAASCSKSKALLWTTTAPPRLAMTAEIRLRDD